MAAVATSSSVLASVNFRGSSIISGTSSLAPTFSALSVSSDGSEFSIPGRNVGKFAVPLGSSSGSLARRKTGCNANVNANSTPESQTTDKELESPTPELSVRSTLDRLQAITLDSPVRNAGTGKTIAQQLADDLEFKESEEVTIPIGSGKLEPIPLTIHQKRNIRRQDYLNKVAKRNDAPFFTAVALFVLVPPAAILGVAVATGYIDLFP